ncbi:serine hydrolase [Lactiplantibacillus argentoratensis]|uniref:Serine hydrolase n=1 Tax=Lactiplantibacillus argentoratensis TaxID=271881 RepID=A0ABS5UG22_9LACO|nr:serine hydrolase domain-containing protein [Lactiplantibacillus argentoratensis]KZU13880.1 Beta-lactamase class C and other penicillinbinding protein [Lactiplantibacillus plantarum]MBT1137472.1 serine hydrolase [Lactiplantibacillus argentoratensis]MBT1140330.1 serine hydrolase [Lactiplantibacillus argentoratensis]
MKGRTRKTVIIFLLFAVVLVAVFIGKKIIDISAANTNVTTSKTVVSHQLEKSLLERTTLDTVRLSNKNKEKLSENNRILSKKEFIGAFLGVRNNKLVYSWRNGYSNTSPNTSFNVNSSVLVGKYQTVLDQALLLSLVNRGYVKLTDELSKYDVSSGAVGKLTVKQLLRNESHLYVRKQSIATIQNPRNKEYSNTLFKKGKSGMSDWVAADTFIKRIVIARATSKSYESIFGQELTNKLGLSNTRFFNARQTYTNDVASYDKKIVNNTRVQSKKLVIKKRSLNGNTLRMSLADIVLSLNGIEKNKLFDSKYTQYFEDYIEQSGVGSLNESVFTYNGNVAGQALAIKSNFDTQSTVVLITNYSDSDVSLTKHLSQLYRIL